MNRPSAPAESSAPEQMMFALLGAAHAFEDRVEAQLGQVGLSMSKLGVLTQLVDSGRPLPLSELAARLSCVRSNMTQLIDRLEADGLVRRVDDATDRRSVLAMVTELGEQRQAAGALALTRASAQFATVLPDGCQDTLLKALAALKG
jgi:DNA-binding MarR family transcriptional regulator